MTNFQRYRLIQLQNVNATSMSSQKSTERTSRFTVERSRSFRFFYYVFISKEQAGKPLSTKGLFQAWEFASLDSLEA